MHDMNDFNRNLLFAALAVGLLGRLGADTLTVPLLENEHWWGGHTFMGRDMPYSGEKPFSDTLIGNNAQNQTEGLLLSSKGRWVWNEEPFAFAFSNGVLRATDTGRGLFQTGEAAERTLRGAFRAASARFFPPSGQMPDPLFFTAPQWNTWVELTYDQNQADILAYARAVVANGFSPGVLMVDDTWQHGYGVWEFNRARFPDARAMCDELHALGFKVMLWVCPYVGLDTWELREELLKTEPKGVLMDASGTVPAVFRWWNGWSACVDFSSATGRGWFKAKLDRLQEAYGIDGFKFDAGDMAAYGMVDFRAATPEGATAHGQSRLYGEIGLAYPLNEYRTVWQLAGQPLAQRLQDKGNDWESLRQCVTDILACGVMGYSFCCPDMVGGGVWTLYRGKSLAKADFRAVVRSAQMQALMPMMQFSLAPWRVLSAPKDRPLLEAIRKAVAVRARFTPRILDLARKSAKTGEPIAAHMAYAFSGQGYEKVNDQWALGEDVIVAPVLSADSARAVLLPEGAWRDDLGATHRGPTRLELKAVPLDRLPFYERVRDSAEGQAPLVE